MSTGAGDNIKAMILAAGMGTRLRPFTDRHPKALFMRDGKTLLEHAIGHLRSAGITAMIINVHHFADQIVGFLKARENFGLDIALSDETGELLETGGGLKKAAWFLQDCHCAVVRNVDVLSDLDLSQLVDWHLETGALATLAVRNRITSRYFLFDSRMRLCGWENRKTGERKIIREMDEYNSMAFNGIQVVSPKMFPMITETGKFSLTELYLRLSAGGQIIGFRDEAPHWEDVGTMSNNTSEKQ